jgi:PEP-CTERM motif
VSLSGNGFGANTTALTIQSHGPASNSESGCIAPGLIGGGSACAPGDGVVGGSESSPIGFPKQAAPSLSSLGITSGSQIGILFDGVQPQSGNNNVLNINDLTLKLYSGSTLLYQVSGSFSNLATNPGNGTSDYLFTLDPSAVNAFNAAFAGNSNDFIALDSTISFPNQSAGPDSYSFVNLNNGSTPSPMPEPSSLLLLGSGVAGTAGLLRRRLFRT